MNKSFKNGITIIETILTVAIIGILVIIILPQFSKMKENQVAKNSMGDVASALRGAQSKSLASLDSSEYGVRLEADRVIIFKGKVFSEGAGGNEITDIISPASISNITLNGVSATAGDLYFERISGTPSKTGTITISTPSYAKVVTVSATGAVSSN